MRAWRAFRLLWPLLFLLPLGVFAGRFCWIGLVDPVYHSWLSLHERFELVLVLLALLTIAVAVYRFIVVQRSLRALIRLSQPPPARVERAFMGRNLPALQLLYVPANQAFCFTIFNGPTVVMSSAFEEQISDEELDFVAMHEALHVWRRDPWRALAWHLGLAMLILPGFEGIEEGLHIARERAVDAQVQARTSTDRYRDLLSRLSGKRGIANAPLCTNALARRRNGAFNKGRLGFWTVRVLPAAISVALLGLVASSHAAFTQSLPYLETHHC